MLANGKEFLEEQISDSQETQIIENTETQTDAQEIVQQAVSSKGMRVNHDIITVSKGDSFIGILTGLGLDYSKATDIYNVYKKSL